MSFKTTPNIIKLWFLLPLLVSIYSYLSDLILSFNQTIKDSSNILIYFFNYFVVHNLVFLVIVVIYHLIFNNLDRSKHLFLKICFTIVIAAIYVKFIYWVNYDLLSLPQLKIFTIFALAGITAVLILEFYLKNRRVC